MRAEAGGVILRNVEVEGRGGLDVRLEDGRIAEIAPKLSARGDELDGQGGALIPGLADHHIHLFAAAAQASSIDVSGAANPAQFGERVTRAAAARPPGAWLRITGYHERIAGELSREALDRLAPAHRLRVQHQTGALWVLNSAALASVCGDDAPNFVEPATGRIWRGDAWLRAQLGAEPPPLADLGRELAAYGITALTDASVTTDATSASALAAAVRSGDLPQRVTLMSGGALEAPADAAFALGPVKVLLDDHALPEFDDFVGRIRQARAWKRAVAVHCVTAGELALSLAAFEAAGAQPGDRIEHGGVIPAAAIGQLKALGLAVVTQSAFIRERGDRYAAEVPEAEQPDLYRCASLQRAGVAVAGSSDTPYASPDPWAGMAAAVARRTLGGRVMGEEERVSPRTALALYLGRPEDPGGPPRRVAVGEPADLCLLKAPLREVLADPTAEAVRTTLLAGRLTHFAA
jgi:predicted amidohydrolase YtcJ